MPLATSLSLGDFRNFKSLAHLSRGNFFEFLRPYALQLVLVSVLFVRGEGLLLSVDIFQASGIRGTHIVRGVLFLELFMLALSRTERITLGVRVVALLYLFQEFLEVCLTSFQLVLARRQRNRWYCCFALR